MSIPYSQVPPPAFVLDEARLRKNLERIQSVQKRSGAQVILALKGFAFWRVFPMVGEYLCGATASSLYEARLIFEEMGVRAHTYAPAYTDADFGAIAHLSSHLTFNSLTQFERFSGHPQLLESNTSLGLRVNPGYSDVEVALYNPADPRSRLGVSWEALGDKLPPGLEGIHVHTLCESSAAATQQLIETVEQRLGHLLPHLKWINFGGGHLMTRAGYDLDVLVHALQGFIARYPHLDVFLEPGSAIAWDTGELVATVLDVVENAGVKTAILDVSFTAHMPDTLEMPYRPRILGAGDPVEGKPSYRLGGVSCLAGDFMECYAFDQPLEPGDRIVFMDMMHYTMVKTTMFNGVKHPDICIWRESGELEVVRQFTFEDFKRRLS
ncbi:MAG: carboxynorspermidine decarboxylase [Saprospiraceae bacterium]